MTRVQTEPEALRALAARMRELVRTSALAVEGLGSALERLGERWRDAEYEAFSRQLCQTRSGIDRWGARADGLASLLEGDAACLEAYLELPPGKDGGAAPAPRAAAGRGSSLLAELPLPVALLLAAAGLGAWLEVPGSLGTNHPAAPEAPRKDSGELRQLERQLVRARADLGRGRPRGSGQEREPEGVPSREVPPESLLARLPPGPSLFLAVSGLGVLLDLLAPRGPGAGEPGPAEDGAHRGTRRLPRERVRALQARLGRARKAIAGRQAWFPADAARAAVARRRALLEELAPDDHPPRGARAEPGAARAPARSDLFSLRLPQFLAEWASSPPDAHRAAFLGRLSGLSLPEVSQGREALATFPEADLLCLALEAALSFLGELLESPQGRFPLPAGWRWIPLDEIDLNELPDEFPKVTYAEMVRGLCLLESEVVPAMERLGPRADRWYFARLDQEAGLTYEHGLQRAYEAFFGGDPIYLDRQQERWILIDGRHRVRVARDLGWKAVPARTSQP